MKRKYDHNICKYIHPFSKLLQFENIFEIYVFCFLIIKVMNDACILCLKKQYFV